MTRFDAILVELRRRKVFRSAAAYGLVAFAVLQVVEPVMHGLDLPDWILKAVVILLALGFPVAMVLAWIFDLGPQGMERTVGVQVEGEPVSATSGPTGPAPPRLRRWAVKPSWSVVALLAMTAGGLAAWRWTAAPPPAGPRVTVAVADFINRTDDHELDGLSGLLITSLEQSRRLAVLTRSRMLDELKLLGRADPERVDEATGRDVARRLGVRALITASVHHFDKVYTVELKALDPGSSEYLFTLKEEARGKSSLPALIDRLSERAREALRESAPDVRATRIEVGRAVTSNLEAYGHYFRAEQLQNRGDYDGAIAEYELAIKADPDFALAHLGIAYLSEFWGVPAERKQRAIEAAIRAAPRLPEKERLLVLAWQAVLERRPADAQATYARAMADFPPDKEVLYLAADQLHHLGELETALPIFERALQLDPGYSPAAVHLVSELAELGRLAEALAVAERAERADPEGARGLVVVARQARGEQLQALALLEQQARSNDPEALSTYCVALSFAGDRRRAAESLRRLEAASDKPDAQVELWHTRARIAAMAGRLREAVAMGHRGMQFPGVSFGHLNHARGFVLFMAAGQPGGLGAERALIDGLVPDSFEAPQVGFLLAWLGDPGAASGLVPGEMKRVVAAIGRWRSSDPASAAADLRRFSLEAGQLTLWLLGELELERGRPKEAAAALERYVRSGSASRDWTSTRALVRLAQAREQLGDQAGARAALDRYFSLLDRPDPDLPLQAEARTLRRRLGPAGTNPAH
jgi:tetratricopeptide (TPR) repeat protein